MVMDVTPEEIRSAAKKIDEHVAAYKQAVDDFYNQVNSLSGSLYEGQAAVAFRQKAADFEDDFTKMSQRMDAYANYLRNAANTYESAHTSVEQKAKALRS